MRDGFFVPERLGKTAAVIGILAGIALTILRKIKRFRDTRRDAGGK